METTQENKNQSTENLAARNELDLDVISTEFYQIKVLSDTLTSILDDLGKHVYKFRRGEKDAAYFLAHDMEIEWEKLHCLSSVIRRMARDMEREIDER